MVDSDGGINLLSAVCVVCSAFEPVYKLTSLLHQKQTFLTYVLPVICTYQTIKIYTFAFM